MNVSTTVLRGQNFLLYPSIAERLVKAADPAPSQVCVDIGAGKGIITQACLAAGFRVVSIEVDSRLFARLQNRFGSNPKVKLVNRDLISVARPRTPFCIISNPPFNQSTEIFRHWIMNTRFQSAAIIMQHQFIKKMAGDYGATKLSTAIAPFRSIEVSEILSKNIFRPRPGVQVSLARVAPVTDSIPWSERKNYWLFTNYLFERGPTTICDILEPLPLPRISQRIMKRRLRDLKPHQIVELYELVNSTPTAWQKIRSFNRGLSEKRRLRLGDARGM